VQTSIQHSLSCVNAGACLVFRCEAQGERRGLQANFGAFLWREMESSALPDAGSMIIHLANVPWSLTLVHGNAVAWRL
jgi:hypothetical protein